MGVFVPGVPKGLTGGEFVRRRRTILGLTQAELADKSGVAQPRIAEIEAGKRELTEVYAKNLLRALAVKPSEIMQKMRAEIRDKFQSLGLNEASVFGSAASGKDEPGSALDFCVLINKESPAVGGLELMRLEAELERLTTVPVDINVDLGRPSPALDRMRRERVRL